MKRFYLKIIIALLTFGIGFAAVSLHNLSEKLSCADALMSRREKETMRCVSPEDYGKNSRDMVFIDKDESKFRSKYESAD